MCAKIWRLIRRLRERLSARPSSCYDQAVDLAGVLKGLPEDLAVNPKYLEGFGE
jgi:hypothetical protein